VERPRLEVADILRRYGAAYRAEHEPSLSNAQRRVMRAITACRTAALGGHVEACDSCAHPLSNAELSMLLEGIDWRRVRRTTLAPIDPDRVVPTRAA
jgi:hypothetical protein